MNRTLAARLARSKHQFDVVDKVDSEQVFGHDEGMIEQAFARTSAGAGEAGPGEVSRMRLTRRGRILVRALAVVLVVAGFMLVAPGLARGDGPDRPAPRVTYVVESGDTLWSIARRVAPGQDPRPVVDGLIEANHVRDGLQVGQELSIPVPER
jgi:nucleoid-associated protein YgaU